MSRTRRVTGYQDPGRGHVASATANTAFERHAPRVIICARNCRAITDVCRPHGTRSSRTEPMCKTHLATMDSRYRVSTWTVPVGAARRARCNRTWYTRFFNPAMGECRVFHGSPFLVSQHRIYFSLLWRNKNNNNNNDLHVICYRFILSLMSVLSVIAYMYYFKYKVPIA